MTTEIRRAQALINDQADPCIVETITALLETRAADWHLDPHVPGVVGLIRRSDTRALAVVYLNGSDDAESTFEISGELEEGAATVDKLKPPRHLWDEA